MIDLKAELNNFKAINLNEIDNGELLVSDKIRNSILLFNKAIESIKSGSEDIAIIELKKAVAINPQFNEAFNLLGLCYSYIGETEKAAEVFSKVIKDESNSLLASRYMQMIGFGEPVQKQSSKRITKPITDNDKQEEPIKRIRRKPAANKNDSRKSLLYTIAKIGGGFAAGILIAIIFFMPSRNTNVPQTPIVDTADSETAAKMAEYEENYAKLEEKYNSLQKDKDAAVQQSDYYKSALKLYDVDDMYRARQYEEAADMLIIMKTVEFKDSEAEKFNELYTTVLPLAAKTAYNKGSKLFNSKKYQEALDKLKMVEIYDPGFKQMDGAIYYMGRSCQALNDSRNAVAMYQKLVTEYPRSSFVKYANARLKELIQIP